MNGTIFEARGAAAKETQLGIGPVTAMAERAAKEMIEARNAIGAEWRVAGEQGLNFRGECRAYFFVGIEREDPITRGVRNGGVFLRAEALPRLLEHAGTKLAGDFQRGIC